MKILAIETSCDETSASVGELDNNFVRIISNVTATSMNIHAGTGGIIPENAARMQVKYIMPVIIKALCESRNLKDESWEVAKETLKDDIDAIAVTYGPGLIGSLLVGVETAKTLSFTFNKPLIPVNHLLAHIYANFIISNKPSTLSPNPFPFIGLIASGGHSDLLLFKSNNDYKWLGGTRDDAAGEAFDKTGRLLNLSYPAGPEIERRASIFEKKLNPKPSTLNPKFKSPLINSADFDFSFSGLKTEVMRYVQKNPNMNEELKNQICFALQKAIIDVLVIKTLKAAEKYNIKKILIGGGVSANQTFINQLQLNAKQSALNPKIFSPEKIYCTDNAAMIASYALMNYKKENWEEINANPELYFA